MARLLSVEDVLRLARIGGLNATRAGDLAYVVTRPDPQANKDIVEVGVVLRTGERASYTSGSDASPRWSPDGSRLAITSRRGAGEKEKGVGVFVASLKGEPRRVAWFRHGVWLLDWLGPETLLVGSSVPEEGMHDEEGDYVATRRLPLWFNGAGLVAGRTRQLFAVDEWSGRAEQVTREPLGVSSAAACDGRIVYSTPLDWRNPTVHAVKSVRPGAEPVTLAEGLSVQSIVCSHDGTALLLAHRGEIGIASHNRLYMLAPDGELECLTCGLLDRNIWQASPSRDGVALLVADSGRTPVLFLRDGRLETVARGDWVAYSIAAYDDGVYIALSTPVRPVDIYRARIGGGEPERVTRYNAWAEELSLSRPVRLEVEAAGDRVEGWVFLPPEGAPKHGDRAPLVLFVHGGPKGMYGYGFHYEMQLFAAQGFIVAGANPRGSDGYSEEFADIRGRYGETDYEQLMAFLDRVVEEFPVDTRRMVVTGISYGGYMTNVIVTKTDRFAAAVSENGIADWIADYWAADIGYWFDPDQIGGTPLDNLEEYVRRSPAFHADRVRTPMLIIHSMEDYRCFIDQALAMHTALSTLGKDSTLLVFTRGDHGHSVRAPPRHRRKRLEYKLRWIRKKLGLGDEKE